MSEVGSQNEELLRHSFEAALAAVDPERVVSEHLVEHDLLSRLGSRARWIAVGKASAAMRRGALAVASDHGSSPAEQWLVQPVTAPPPEPPLVASDGRWFGGEHPVPGPRGAVAAGALLEALRDPQPGMTGTLVLLSGGASAMLPAPPDTVPLNDKAEVTRRLLRAGATIDQFNTVRRHLSRIKGGGLARALVENSPANATVEVLVLSDVVGDDLATIASGPCVGDPTTFADALYVLRSLEVDVPATVARYLQRGAIGLEPETPFPDDPLFERVTHQIVAGNDTAVAAVVRSLEATLSGSGRRVVDAVGVTTEAAPTVSRSGEAREVAHRVVELAKTLWDESPDEALAVVWGGETTVTVRGGGRGGRNQEFALAAALELDAGLGSATQAASWAVFAAGTDGVDGPTSAAGGSLDAVRLAELRRRVDPLAALEDNDSHRALAAAGALVEIGPTGTNVADVAMVLIGPRG